MNTTTRFRWLRNLLLLDSAVLLLLGALLIFAPKMVEAAFQFHDLPRGAQYILGMYGCVLATLGIGYFVAALDPQRSAAWVLMGIARGALECIAGAVYAARGIVTWQQAAFGMAVAAFIVLAYILLYPRHGTEQALRT